MNDAARSPRYVLSLFINNGISRYPLYDSNIIICGVVYELSNNYIALLNATTFFSRIIPVADQQR